MPINISKEIENEVNRSAVLSQYVYFNMQEHDFHDKSLGEIINELNPERKEYKLFKSIIDEDPYIGRLKVISQSSIDSVYPLEHLASVIFESEDDNKIYFIYRGTGDGQWIDNGDALIKESSFMQQVAEKYFDEFIENNYIENNLGKRLIAAGHSKGGNLAQFITLSSKYSEVIDATYSFDGQGFSKLALEYFRRKYGLQHFDNQIKKIYAVNGKNDFVSPLGMNVVPYERSYFIRTTNGMNGWHSISKMLTGAKLNWIKDVNDYILHGESGPVRRFMCELSDSMMQLDGEDLDDLVITVMSVIEALLSYEDVPGGKYKYGTGDRSFMTIDDFIGFITNGIPMIINTILNNEDVSGYGWGVFKNSLKKIGSGEKGSWKLIGIIIALILISPLTKIFLGSTWILFRTIEEIEYILKHITDKKEIIDRIFTNMKYATGMFVEQVYIMGI